MPQRKIPNRLDPAGIMDVFPRSYRLVSLALCRALYRRINSQFLMRIKYVAPWIVAISGALIFSAGKSEVGWSLQRVKEYHTQ